MRRKRHSAVRNGRSRGGRASLVIGEAGGLPVRLRTALRRRAPAELPVDLELRGLVLPDHPELGDNLAAGLLLLDLLREEPLELDDRRVGLRVEGELVE